MGLRSLGTFELPTADKDVWQASHTPSPGGVDTCAQYHYLVTPSGPNSYIEASA